MFTLSELITKSNIELLGVVQVYLYSSNRHRFIKMFNYNDIEKEFKDEEKDYKLTYRLYDRFIIDYISVTDKIIYVIERSWWNGRCKIKN